MLSLDDIYIWLIWLGHNSDEISFYRAAEVWLRGEKDE
jgi:hypothetical protein